MRASFLFIRDFCFFVESLIFWYNDAITSKKFYPAPHRFALCDWASITTKY